MRISPINNQAFTSLKLSDDKLTKKVVGRILDASKEGSKAEKEIADTLFDTIKELDKASGKHEYILRATNNDAYDARLSISDSNIQKGKRGYVTMHMRFEVRNKDKCFEMIPTTSNRKISIIQDFKEKAMQFFKKEAKGNNKVDDFYSRLN